MDREEALIKLTCAYLAGNGSPDDARTPTLQAANAIKAAQVALSLILEDVKSSRQTRSW
jgi:hypothetical protein